MPHRIDTPPLPPPPPSSSSPQAPRSPIEDDYFDIHRYYYELDRYYVFADDSDYNYSESDDSEYDGPEQPDDEGADDETYEVPRNFSIRLWVEDLSQFTNVRAQVDSLFFPTSIQVQKYLNYDSLFSVVLTWDDVEYDGQPLDPFVAEEQILEHHSGRIRFTE
ncbi:hypothetical protein MAC_07213 [Metarhizium acridum CQMa 102]|uniref:Uncharacterized protein n=1 Tax=Metarhizium acridum (strain CQMa 102) TaxID=655827 RepID=E9EBG5_METAQ|nr:uncharacterized protein MAC_07213 [Metarhizium acridum CQMa 102]EFY86712.1 hypothetical protein MAC_07213 [Metarhizium acridum CQMa 102]